VCSILLIPPPLPASWRNSPQWARSSLLSRLERLPSDTPQSVGLLSGRVIGLTQKSVLTSHNTHKRHSYCRRESNPQFKPTPLTARPLESAQYTFTSVRLCLSTSTIAYTACRLFSELRCRYCLQKVAQQAGFS